MAKKKPKQMDAATRFLLQWVEKQNAYVDVAFKGDAGICGIAPLMFTYAIVSGCNRFGYEDRWCYKTYDDAKKAFDAWDGKDDTEPQGWHRHPSTGRRVNEETGELYMHF